ncbi:MAG: hypothetical protein JNJ83_10535 [Verrucomicrobiaceae bacterium]|nr:hypothetical protein [Verrucomicrobiaceae bacterium]
MTKASSTTLACSRDIVVIGLVLGLVNMGLSRGDFGWLGLNPTPWLLLPILIGGRYGLTQGLVSGVFTAGLIVVTRGLWIEHRSPKIIAGDHLYEMGSLLLLGFLAGQWRQMQSNRHEELKAENEVLGESLLRVQAEVALVRESRQEAERQLALHNVVLTNLDDDLHQLLTSPAGGFLPGLLDLVHRHGGVTSMAVYQVEGDELKRLAGLHLTPPLAEKLDLRQTPLAARALDERAISVVRDAMTASAEQPFLAALPWSDGKASGVLLIQDMPLDSLSWENLARVELIVHWAFALARWGRKLASDKGKQSLVPVADFMLLVGQALQVEQTHRVPSVVVRADLLDKAQVAAAELPPSLLRLLPKSAVACHVDASLMVFLPFGGQAEGDALVRTLKDADVKVRCCHYLTAGTTDVRTFWGRVMEAA